MSPDRVNHYLGNRVRTKRCVLLVSVSLSNLTIIWLQPLRRPGGGGLGGGREGRGRGEGVLGSTAVVAVDLFPK